MAAITIHTIAQYLETIAPSAYQEDYDNVGLLVGNPANKVTGILLCLDITPAVLQEAKAKACNLVLAHHPIVFKPIKKLTSQSLEGACIMQAIKNNIALYALHTNLDNMRYGVNHALATQLGLQDPQVLAPKPGLWSQLTTLVPAAAATSVRRALHQAGAGMLGKYMQCSFTSSGTGAFLPLPGAKPQAGTG